MKRYSRKSDEERGECICWRFSTRIYRTDYSFTWPLIPFATAKAFCQRVLPRILLKFNYDRVTQLFCPRYASLSLSTRSCVRNWQCHSYGTSQRIFASGCTFAKSSKWQPRINLYKRNTESDAITRFIYFFFIHISVYYYFETFIAAFRGVLFYQRIIFEILFIILRENSYLYL